MGAITEAAAEFWARVIPDEQWKRDALLVTRCHCDEPSCTGWATQTRSFVTGWEQAGIGPAIQVALDPRDERS